jgi:hypothetical protein
LTSAINTGQARISNTKEPAIWPAKVDVKEVVKNASDSLMLVLGFHMFLTANDCKGEAKTRSPISWNHNNGG